MEREGFSRAITRVAVALLATAALTGAAQPPPYILHGRVVAAVTGDAIRNARVSVTAGRDVPAVLSDGEGRFTIPDLPRASSFTVTATKPGFAQASITVAPSSADAVVVAVQRGAAISGVVVDETGEPVPDASVMVDRADDDAGGRKTQTVCLTDDAGRYRIGSLAPGRVLVSIFMTARSVVMLPNGGMLTTGPLTSVPGGLQRRLYYPGGNKADTGEPLALQPGDEKLAIDFVVPGSIPTGPRVTPAPRDMTVVSGHIVSADGRPLAGAQVSLLAVDGARVSRQAVSDGEGAYQFVMPADASGTFRLIAFRSGYLGAAYGQRAPTDAPAEIALVAGETRANVDVVLARFGAIAGRLFDENGDPVEHAALRAMRLTYADGRRRLTQVPIAMGAGRTDDLGRYRITSLAPARYFVAALIGQIVVTDPTEDLPGYAQTYYPGTPNAAEGQFVTIGRSQELTGVDFSIARASTARVAGRAFETNGDPITGGIALVPSRRSGALVDTQLGARIDRDGNFAFENVAPGEYVLQAARHRNGGWNEGESTVRFITVEGGDVTGIELRTTPGSTVTGRIVVEDDGMLRQGEIEISPVPTDTDLTAMIGGGAARALIDKDLHFEIAGLHGTRRLTVTRILPGWNVKAIRHNGSDMTDAVLPFGREDQSLTEVEVVVTPRGTDISGTVVDDRNRRVADAMVIALPPDRSLWYRTSRSVGSVSATRDGRFSLRGLAPGDYHLIVVDTTANDDLVSEIEDPDVLESLIIGAQRVTLDEGEHVQVALKLPKR